MNTGQGLASLQDPRVAIVAIDSTGSVTKVNRQASKYLHEAVKDLEGPNLGALVANFFGHVRRGGTARLIFSSEDEDIPEVTVVLSEDEQRESVRSSAIYAERVMADQHKAADYIAHELKNPLGTILGLARLLRFRIGPVDDPSRGEAIETIESEAEKALLIVEALLRLVQSRTRETFIASDVPVHAVLRKVITDHQRRHPERSVVLSGDYPTYARGDSMGVELAIGNLLTNADKYSPLDEEIEVAVHQEGNRATIMVVNGGSSLPEERYDELWDIYGGTSEVMASGSGIGLSLCKEIVETMGGRVWAGPNRTGGSVFAVTLPSPS